MTNAWNKSFAGFTTAACLMAPTVALCTESTFLLVCLHWITHHRIYIQYLHLIDCGVPSYAVLLPLTCSSYDMRLHSLLSFPLACQLCTSTSSSSSRPFFVLSIFGGFLLWFCCCDDFFIIFIAEACSNSFCLKGDLVKSKAPSDFLFLVLAILVLGRGQMLLGLLSVCLCLWAWDKSVILWAYGPENANFWP